MKLFAKKKQDNKASDSPFEIDRRYAPIDQNLIKLNQESPLEVEQRLNPNPSRKV